MRVNWHQLFYEDLRSRLLDQIRMISRPGVEDKLRDLTGTDIRVLNTALLECLEDVNTKRMIFDTEQAVVFEELDEAPPENFRATMLHAPFRQFYLEFTEPILIQPQEPGHSDALRALLFVGDMVDVQYEISEVGAIGFPLSQVTMFLTDENNELVDRTFKYNLQSAQAVVLVSNVRQQPDPSGVPETWPDESYMLATLEISGMDNRHIGWWERVTQKYAIFMDWLLVYMIAKSVVIVEEPISRQQKRWHERKNLLPRPWHVVKVDPKIYTGRTQEESQYHVSHRFDVMGHLRFNKHRIKVDDKWSYKDTVEWVPAHQRGLQHSLYIPKTYMVERGRSAKLPMRREDQ